MPAPSRRSTGASRAARHARVVAIVSLLLAACTAPQRPADSIVYASGTDLESGDPLVTIHPLSRQVQRFALFVTLARLDSSLAVVPYYATRWTWSDDRRALVLHLASGVRWHDGPPTTARDVAFTLDAARDPTTGYARAGDLAAIVATRALDDSTLRIDFAQPAAEFPEVLCELPIVPAHLLGEVPRSALRRAPFDRAPVGNGPFRFADRRAGARWTFVRNDDFPASLGGPPRAASLVVVVVDEATTKFAGLASGDLDVAGISPATARLAARDPTLRVIDYPVLFSVGLVFNTHRSPFDDVRVRRAVNLAVDRERIVRAALAGYGRAASGPVSPENPLADGTALRVDPTAARALLDSAGWRVGAKGIRRRDDRALAVELLTVGSGDNAVEQLLQSDLGAIGIDVAIRQLELGAFLGRARASEKDYDMLITGIPGDLSLAYLGAMFESRQAGGALDYAGFHEPRLDTLFAVARNAPTTAVRRGALLGVQRELADAVPVAWIYHARGLQGISARLAGVRMDLRGELATVARWRAAPLAGFDTAPLAARR